MVILFEGPGGGAPIDISGIVKNGFNVLAEMFWTSSVSNTGINCARGCETARVRPTIIADKSGTIFDQNVSDGGCGCQTFTATFDETVDLTDLLSDDDTNILVTAQIIKVTTNAPKSFLFPVVKFNFSQINQNIENGIIFRTWSYSVTVDGSDLIRPFIGKLVIQIGDQNVKKLVEFNLNIIPGQKLDFEDVIENDIQLNGFSINIITQVFLLDSSNFVVFEQTFNTPILQAGQNGLSTNQLIGIIALAVTGAGIAAGVVLAKKQ